MIRGRNWLKRFAKEERDRESRKSAKNSSSHLATYYFRTSALIIFCQLFSDFSRSFCMHPCLCTFFNSMVLMRKEDSLKLTKHLWKSRFLLEMTARFCFLPQCAILVCCRLLLMVTLHVNEAVSNQKTLLTSLVWLVEESAAKLHIQAAFSGSGGTSTN